MRIQELEAVLAKVNQVFAEKPVPPYCADPYAERMQAAIRAVCRPDYPAGMVPWLAEHEPALYEELTGRLRDEINWLWDAHAPIEEFQRVLDAWIEAHRQGCALYREFLAAQSDGATK